MKYDYYSDPSHGWLKVPRKTLILLGIEHTISSCSYQRGDMVYLEQDDDAPKFLTALKTKRGQEATFREHSTNRRSRIRGYEPFSCTVIPADRKPVTAEDYAPVNRPYVNTSKPNVNGTPVKVGDNVQYKNTVGRIIGILPHDEDQGFTLFVDNDNGSPVTICSSSECYIPVTG